MQMSGNRTFFFFSVKSNVKNDGFLLHQDLLMENLRLAHKFFNQCKCLELQVYLYYLLISQREKKAITML